MATGPIHQWARVGAARAERAGGRSGDRGGAGKRARRSGAQPGLDEVEKPVTGSLGAWCVSLLRLLGPMVTDVASSPLPEP